MQAKTVTKLQVHLTAVMCLMKVIVSISCCGPRHCLPIDNVLCIVPFTGEHLITKVILSFYLKTAQIWQQVSKEKVKVSLNQKKIMWGKKQHETKMLSFERISMENLTTVMPLMTQSTCINKYTHYCH